jgi:hypothetical protein
VREGQEEGGRRGECGSGEGRRRRSGGGQKAKWVDKGPRSRVWRRKEGGEVEYLSILYIRERERERKRT